MNIYDTQKNGTDEPICKAEIDMDAQNRLVDTADKERVKHIEGGIEVYTWPRKIDG